MVITREIYRPSPKGKANQFDQFENEKCFCHFISKVIWRKLAGVDVTRMRKMWLTETNYEMVRQHWSVAKSGGVAIQPPYITGLSKVEMHNECQRIYEKERMDDQEAVA